MLLLIVCYTDDFRSNDVTGAEMYGNYSKLSNLGKFAIVFQPAVFATRVLHDRSTDGLCTLQAVALLLINLFFFPKGFWGYLRTWSLFLDYDAHEIRWRVQ